MSVVNYKVYKDGLDFIGITQHDAPAISAVVAEMKGAGIGGSVELPVQGLVQSMSMTLNFRDITPQTKLILTPEAHHIELWAAIQDTDPKTGQFVVKQHKLIYRAIPKTNTVGKFVPGETQDRSVEFSVLYYREIYDGQDIVEIDPLNNVYRVAGKDANSDVRKAIGI
ncbi:phage major tail tube protein [Gilliamella apicola]|uniref:phage major tail tube protein n=1 Tax=Gilliamella apicola TaxID=1196095 RepID=UPI003987E7AC